ncbi:MAG: hypothetical protein N2C12_13110, partial [Planctomycetales bacterium]
LALLDAFEERPNSEYALGSDIEEVVVWQLGEFREARAVDQLNFIASFDPSSTGRGLIGRTREELVALAREALAKICGGET